MLLLLLLLLYISPNNLIIGLKRGLFRPELFFRGYAVNQSNIFHPDDFHCNTPEKPENSSHMQEQQRCPDVRLWSLSH